MARRWAGCAGILLALSPLSAFAQSSGQCRLPPSLVTPRAERPDSPEDVRRVAIGGYTLALSWSPEYCASRFPGGGFQCSGGNRFGFVLHGLWPEGKGQNWPQWCAPVAPIPHEVLRENLCTIPGERLMQHEWAKHGSCVAKTPKAFFDRARGLYQRLRFPDMNWLAGRYRVTAGDVAGAFARANPGMRIDMLRVQATRIGALSEIQICLDTAFQPARCPAGKPGLSANARVRVRPSLIPVPIDPK